MQVSCRFDHILLTPGPTQVPNRIFEAMSVPNMHHRTDTFKNYLKEARQGIKWLTRADSEPIFIAGSGTAAMEAALINTCCGNDKILVLNAGKFGERWLDIARKLGIQADELKAETGESINLDDLESYLQKNRDLKAICMQYTETSTTVEVPVKITCDLIHKLNPQVLTIVDAVSAIATTPIHLDQQKIDVLVSAAHKGLMLPPGLAILNINEKAWKEIDKINAKSLYFDLKLERKALEKDTTAWTPAMNHIMALCESIKMIKEEGEEKVYERHLALAEITRSAFTNLGLKLMSTKYPSAAVTGAYMPDGVDAEKIRKIMFKEHKVQVAGGQEELQGKVIRFGHMGYCGKDNVLKGIEALKLALGK